jgi:hypothetical protein
MQVGEHRFWSWNAPNAGCRTFSLEMIKAGAYVLVCELGGRDCLFGFFLAEVLAEQVYPAMHRMGD